MGNNTTNPATQQVPKTNITTAPKKKSNQLFKSTVASSHDSSSFGGGVDPRDKFRQDIQKKTDKGKLPPMRMQHRFKFYVWESGIFGLGHDSIVIGSGEDKLERFGWFTIELRVECNDLDEVVIPYTDFIPRKKGLIEMKKWKYQYSVDTTIDELINFTIELINNHGTYRSFHNGCQQFVYSFLHTINSSEYSTKLKIALENDDKYQAALKKPALFSSGTRVYRKCKIKNKVRDDIGIGGYMTAKEQTVLITTLLIVPEAAMAFSNDNTRDQVNWDPNTSDHDTDSNEDEDENIEQKHQQNDT